MHIEATFTTFCAKIQMRRFRRRRRYRRLGNVVNNEEYAAAAAAAGVRGTTPKFWKIRVTPKLRLKVTSSSVAVLRRLRNAYVGMMLCFAGRVAQLNHGNVHLFQKTNVPQFFA